MSSRFLTLRSNTVSDNLSGKSILQDFSRICNRPVIIGAFPRLAEIRLTSPGGLDILHRKIRRFSAICLIGCVFMQDSVTCQLKIHKKPPLPTIALAVVCASAVILARMLPPHSLLEIGGSAFPYTDLFVILAAGIGGLECGLLSFVILFIGEFIRIGGDVSLYSVSTYLILVLLSAFLACHGWFQGWKKSLLPCALLSAVLALCWLVTFTIVIPNPDFENVFRGLPYWALVLRALPETAIATACISLFFHFAPDSVKMCVGSGWVYVCSACKEEPPRQILAVRVTFFSLMEALILCLSAIVCVNYFSASVENAAFSVSYVLSKWRENMQIGLTMLCAAVPVAYLFNMFMMKSVVYPINSMAFLMERYFSASEQERARALPDLNISTGDEVEALYHSLQKMAADMALHIDQRIEQERRSARLTKEFMLALAKAVDAKDHYTSGHSFRVAKYAKEIARRMGKTEKEQEDIYTMGLLHDIGKIGIPEAIINKKGKLTDEEFQKIREHPVLGHGILQYVEELPELATGARWHHERYDGRGYPDGLQGEEIPEEARIICVADAYDALTSNRAYSSIRPQSEVRAEIVRCKGSQFDPAMADIMIAMIDDDKTYRMHEKTFPKKET